MSVRDCSSHFDWATRGNKNVTPRSHCHHTLFLLSTNLCHFKYESSYHSVPTPVPWTGESPRSSATSKERKTCVIGSDPSSSLAPIDRKILPPWTHIDRMRQPSTPPFLQTGVIESFHASSSGSLRRRRRRGTNVFFQFASETALLARISCPRIASEVCFVAIYSSRLAAISASSTHSPETRTGGSQ